MLLIMMLLPNQIELLEGIIIEASFFLDFDLLIGKANNCHKKLQKNKTHHQEIRVEIKNS